MNDTLEKIIKQLEHLTCEVAYIKGFLKGQSYNGRTTCTQEEVDKSNTDEHRGNSK